MFSISNIESDPAGIPDIYRTNLVKFVVQDRGERTVSGWNLEDESAVLLSEDLDQSQNGLDRAQHRVAGGSQRNLVVTFSELIVFSLGPAEDHLEVNSLVGVHTVK